MKNCAARLFFTVMVLTTTSGFAAPFSPGSLVVLQVGDGSASLSSSATAVFVKELTTNGAVLQTITVPATGGSKLTLSGTATTDGEIAVSADKILLTFAGYVATAGTAGPVGADASTVNRAVGVLDTNGNFLRVAVSDTACNGANVRGAVSDGVNYWFSGDSGDSGDTLGGIWFSSNGGAPLQVRPGNLRAVAIVGSQLYFSPPLPVVRMASTITSACRRRRSRAAPRSMQPAA